MCELTGQYHKVDSSEALDAEVAKAAGGAGGRARGRVALPRQGHRGGFRRRRRARRPMQPHRQCPSRCRPSSTTPTGHSIRARTHALELALGGRRRQPRTARARGAAQAVGRGGAAHARRFPRDRCQWQGAPHRPPLAGHGTRARAPTSSSTAATSPSRSACRARYSRNSSSTTHHLYVDGSPREPERRRRQRAARARRRRAGARGHRQRAHLRRCHRRERPGRRRRRWRQGRFIEFYKRKDPHDPR